MKKIVSILLVLVTVLSMGTMAFAEETQSVTGGTTTLTTTVPPATYTLNIPADQTIAFGTTEAVIGSVYLSGAKNFRTGKNIDVTVGFTPFSSSENSCTIPYTLTMHSTTKTNYSKQIMSGNVITFEGTDTSITKYPQAYFAGSGVATGSVQVSMDELIINISEAAWGKALGGDYTATITFTSEVVLAN